MHRLDKSSLHIPKWFGLFIHDWSPATAEGIWRLAEKRLSFRYNLFLQIISSLEIRPLLRHLYKIMVLREQCVNQWNRIVLEIPLKSIKYKLRQNSTVFPFPFYKMFSELSTLGSTPHRALVQYKERLSGKRIHINNDKTGVIPIS